MSNVFQMNTSVDSKQAQLGAFHLLDEGLSQGKVGHDAHNMIYNLSMILNCDPTVFTKEFLNWKKLRIKEKLCLLNQIESNSEIYSEEGSNLLTYAAQMKEFEQESLTRIEEMEKAILKEYN